MGLEVNHVYREEKQKKTDLGPPRRWGKNRKSISMIVGNIGYLGSKLVSREID